MEWYYVIKGRQFGPVSDEEITRLARSGALASRDLVWNETLEGEWVEAGTVPHLFGLPPETPPPIPPDSAAPPPIPPMPAERPAFDDYPAYGVISLVAPVGLAWDRMKAMLFAPFHMDKWFALGFTAWLATLGQGGLMSPMNLGQLGKQQHPAGPGGAWSNWLGAYMTVIIGVFLALLVVAIVIGALIAWVQARGQFMFLENVVRNTSEVAQPWRRWARQGNSLFWWRLAFGLVCVCVVVVILAAAVWGILVPCLRAHAFVPATVPVIAGVSIALLTFMIVVGYISLFLHDFVVPLMARNAAGAMRAWRLFMALTHGHVRKFLLYGLFHFMLSIVAGTAVVVTVFLTCCIAGCLLIIPYIGTVAMLPVLVFFRLYSLEYLAQYGPQYDLLRAPAEGEAGTATAAP